MENLGIEASASYRLDFNHDWSWTPGINFSYNKNEIKDFVRGWKSIILPRLRFHYEVERGGSYGDIYTYDFQ